MTLRDCPVRIAFDVLQGKWKPLILFFLKERPRRYGDLRSHLPDASEMMLTQHLRELEGERIIDRLESIDFPPHIEYRISSYAEI